MIDKELMDKLSSLYKENQWLRNQNQELNHSITTLKKRNLEVVGVLENVINL